MRGIWWSAGIVLVGLGYGCVGGDAQSRPETVGAQVWTPVGPVGVTSPGFGVVTGRVSALALDPSDATGNHLFLGTTGGGLWKSQNAAASTPGSVQFVPVTDNLAALSGVVEAGLSVGAVTVQPGGTGVVLAGLGDPNDALDSYYGAGLLRSTDGGQTWTRIYKTMDEEDGLGPQDFDFLGEAFAGFAWSTANVQLVVAAVSQAYEGTLVNAVNGGLSYEGLYWSNDGGATWHLGRITDLNGEDVQGPLDAFAQPDGNAATSVVWNPVRQVFVAAVRFHGYYQSADGMNWTQLASQPGTGLTPGNCPTEPAGLGVAGCPIFRGSLAVNPQTGDTFAWTVDEFNQDQGIWQDVCAISGGVCTNPSIAFGVQLGTAALEVSDSNGPATIENGDYNLTLAAVPAGPGAGQDTLVFAGDNDLWKCSVANSCTWRNTTNTTTCMSAQVGEYQHALTWDAANPLLLFVGTDSGIWRSVDQVGETGAECASTESTHWQNLNGAIAGSGAGMTESLAEVGSLAQNSLNAGTMLVGLGANGFAGIVNAPAVAGDWNEVLSGEGGAAVIDSTSTTNSWYASNGAGVSIFHCATASATVACTSAGFGTAPVIGEAQVAEDGLGMPYPADFVQDALDPTQLLIGTCRVWRGPATGAGWSGANAISPALDGVGGSFCDGNALVRSMALLSVPGAGSHSTAGEVIYVGMAGVDDGGGVVPGHVFSATVNSSGTAGSWADLALSPVVNSGLAFNAFGEDVTGLVVDSHDATGGTVYATIDGFDTAAEPIQQLYRTTDGGAHWTAIGSNLPNAPANAVVVDPEDANTVYVATDVGVYATRAVTTCASAACWSAYGSGLPLVPVTALTVTAGGSAGNVLTAGTYGRGVWQIPTATAGVTLTTATVVPTSLTFASQAVGSTSAAQAVILRTTGNAALTVTSVAFTGSAAGDFTETDNCVGVVLPKNNGCTFLVSFSPAAAGVRSASLAINANVAGGALSVPLAGMGVAGATATLLPTSAAFGTQQVGTTSATQNFSVQNAGGSALAISSITVSGPFKKSATTCGALLAAGTACAVTVAFAPTVVGTAAGSLSVVDGVGTQSAALTGTGATGPTDGLSAVSLSFAATVVGQSSPALTVTMTNSGGLPLTGIGTSVTGPYAAVNNCGGQLAAGSSCVFTVTFTPTLTGYQPGTLVVSDALRQQTVTLAGVGLKPAFLKLSPTAIGFGSQQVNVNSTPRTLTISNTGGAPLLSPSFSIGGVGSASFSVGTTTCGASLAAQTSCTAQLIFTPLAAGVTSATVTVSTASLGVAAASAALSGTGITPPMLGVSPTALDFGTVILGNSSDAFTVQVMNAGQVAMNLPTFAVSGAMAADFALSPPGDVTACTAALNPAASCYIQVTFSPSIPGLETATLTVTSSNAVPPVATVNLSGSGAPSIVLQASPTQLSFPATAVGTAASPTTLTLSNLGRQTANSLVLSLTGPYQIVPALTTCGSTLARDSFCTVEIGFDPTASGDEPGSLTATVTNLGVAPLVVPLDGTGIAVGGIATSATQMIFGSVVVQTASAAQTLTITNSGQAALNTLAITSTGDFSLAGDVCPATLAAQASCTTGVVFAPSTTGIRSGTLTVTTSSAGVVPAVVSLTGNGIPAGSLLASPSVVSFGSVTVGQTSPAETVTLTNAGATTLAGLQLRAAGDYSLSQNGCGSQLVSGGVCSFAVTFAPTQPGTRIGTVTVQSSTAGFAGLTVGLTGTGLPTAQLVVSPLQLTFGAVPVGTNSAVVQLTVSNPGTGALAGLSFAAASPFSVGSGSCGASLAAGGSCSVPVTFAPKVSGSQTGVITVASTSLGVIAVQVGVSGTGLAAAALHLTPASLVFAPTTVGATSAVQAVTVSNPGGAGISGVTVTASGDFALASSGCTSVLGAGGSCLVTVSFTPSLSGLRQGFLTVTGSTAGTNAPVTVSGGLTGTGLTPAALSVAPPLLGFGSVLIGNVSTTGLMRVTNTGQTGTTNLQLVFSAGFAMDATKTTCTAALAGGAYCIVGVVFAPTVAGPVTGSLTASLGGKSPVAISLTGTGVSPPGIVTVPAALVSFGVTGVGQSAQPIAVTVTNQGALSALTGLALTVDATGTASGFGLTGNTCGGGTPPGTLGAAASCSANVTFTPPSAGVLTGNLIVSSTNGGAPVTLALSGSGFDFKLAVAGSTSATVVQGQTANYSLSVTAQGGGGGTFSFSCGSLPSNAECIFNPAQLTGLAPNVSATVALGIATGGPVTTAMLGRDGRAWEGALVLVCGLLIVPLRGRRHGAKLLRVGRLSVFVLMLAGAVAGVGSCAGAGGSGGSGGQGQLGGGTPAGTYTIPVTANSNGIAHSVSVTLVVN